MLVSPYMLCAMCDNAGMPESDILHLLRTLPAHSTGYYCATAVSRAIKRAGY